MQKQWVLFFPIIPRHRTDQINLTASNLEKNSVAHRLCTKKGAIIEDFSHPGNNVPYVVNLTSHGSQVIGAITNRKNNIFSKQKLNKNESFKKSSRYGLKT